MKSDFWNMMYDGLIYIYLYRNEFDDILKTIRVCHQRNYWSLFRKEWLRAVSVLKFLNEKKASNLTSIVFTMADLHLKKGKQSWNTGAQQQKDSLVQMKIYHRLQKINSMWSVR